MELKFDDNALEQLRTLKSDTSKARILKEVMKALGYMRTNLRHPSLNTHEFKGVRGKNGEKVFEAYAQNKTPGAYRIFFYYGPEKNEITVFSIIPHP